MVRKIMIKTVCFLVFSVFFIPLVSAEPTTYCSDNNLYLITDLTLNISGNIIPITNTEILNCRYGCSNTTLLNLGNPGCIESDMSVAVIFIVVLLGAIYWMRSIA